MTMIRTDNVFELHPAGTIIELVDNDGDTERYLVGQDGLWRNKYGQVPAGQVAPEPERSRHVNGCPCDEHRLPTGRRSHGGGL